MASYVHLGRDAQIIILEFADGLHSSSLVDNIKKRRDIDKVKVSDSGAHTDSHKLNRQQSYMFRVIRVK